MTTLIHLSDLHFGALDKPVARALGDYLRIVRGDVVVVSGDLTQRARAGQFAAAGEFLAALQSPVLAVPGNHDVPLYAFWERFACPLRRYRRHAEPKYLRAWTDGSVSVVGLNSARPIVPVVRGFWKDGTLGRQDFDMLRAACAAHPAKQTVAVIHHPLLPPPVPVHGLLVGHERVAAELVRSGVSVVLSGHLHVGYAGTLPSQPGLLCVQAGSACSHRRRHDRSGAEIANGFQRLEVDGDRVTVETHECSASGWQKSGSKSWENVGGSWIER